MSKKNTITGEKFEEAGMEFSGISDLANKAGRLLGFDLLPEERTVKIWNEFVEEIENRMVRIRELIK